MKNKVFTSKYYYFLYEALWILLWILIPIYIIVVLFSLDSLQMKINEILIQYFLWGFIFIGIRDFATAHIFLYFSNGQVCIKEGIITGRLLGYSCYNIEELNLKIKKYFFGFEVLTIDTYNTAISLNSPMFSKDDFQNIKKQLQTRKI